MSLKDKLLLTGYFVENEWLVKYCELINSNLNTKYEKFKTQRHHIIPKCYYKFNNLPINNSKENLINLGYVDHAMAHLYLAAAAENNKQFQHRNMKAVDHVLGNVNFKKFDFNLYERDLIINSDLYKNTYEKTKEFWSKTCNFHDPNSQSIEIRRQNGLQNKGRKYINKDGCVKAVKECELNEYLNNGWLLGNSNNAKNHTGRKHMWKDDHQAFVKPSDIDEYLKLGYVFGDKPGSNSHKHGNGRKKTK